MDANAVKRRIIVIAGGELRTELPVRQSAYVIAADSGYDHAMRAGIEVDALVGDLDSISPIGREHATASGTEISPYPTDKDFTDLEVALDAAVELRPQSIDVFGGEGGTIGHLIAGALALTSQRFAGIDIRWHTATGVVRVVRPGEPVTVTGPTDTRVTVIPIGDVAGVHTTGLRWSLRGESLPGGTTRGVSNELEEETATVAVERGTALVVTEGA